MQQLQPVLTVRERSRASDMQGVEFPVMSTFVEFWQGRADDNTKMLLPSVSVFGLFIGLLMASRAVVDSTDQLRILDRRLDGHRLCAIMMREASSEPVSTRFPGLPGRMVSPLK